MITPQQAGDHALPLRTCVNAAARMCMLGLDLTSFDALGRPPDLQKYGHYLWCFFR